MGRDNMKAKGHKHLYFYLKLGASIILHLTTCCKPLISDLRFYEL